LLRRLFRRWRLYCQRRSLLYVLFFSLEVTLILSPVLAIDLDMPYYHAEEQIKRESIQQICRANMETILAGLSLCIEGNFDTILSLVIGVCRIVYAIVSKNIILTKWNSGLLCAWAIENAPSMDLGNHSISMFIFARLPCRVQSLWRGNR
jgi:hypothetical protein